MKAQLALLVVVAAISCCLASGDLVCPEQFDPMHPTFFPHPDCTKYYVCNWQAVVERSCPNGLHWNQQASFCDYPSQAGCSAGTTTTVSPTTTTTLAPATTTTTTTTTTQAPVPSGDCPEVYDPNHQVYFPHADCSKYYICTYEGNKLEQNCPQGLHWSQASSYCDLPELAQCQASFEGSGAEVTEVPEVQECPEGYDPEHPVFFPHEQCEFFYVCINGEAVEQKCPGDLHWNQDKGLCDTQEQAGCVAVTEVPEVQECPEGYDPEHPVFFPHEQCEFFYVCINGEAVEQKCPGDLHWNQDKGLCDTQEQAGCVAVTEPAATEGTEEPTEVPSTEGPSTEVPSTEKPSTEVPSTTTQQTTSTAVPTTTTQKPSTEAPAAECPMEEGDVPVFLPHADCSKYYVCEHGRPIELNCPPGTFWNATENVCDNPASSGCQQQRR